jgi:hypothetical protein
MKKRKFCRDEAEVNSSSKYFCPMYMQIDSDRESFPSDGERLITVNNICQVG